MQGEASFTSSFHVGYEGTGSITVRDGGHLVAYSFSIGSQTNSHGSATVTDVGSILRTRTMGFIGVGVGAGAMGTLYILDGGQIISTGMTIASLADSQGTVTIDGVDSSWRGSVTTVRSFGEGALEITDGATVETNSTGYVGRSARSVGSVTVDGSGPLWELGDQFSLAELLVGEEGISANQRSILPGRTSSLSGDWQ